MMQITDSQSGTITRTYDLLDQLIQETTPQGAVSYAYDGRRPADKHDCSWPAPGRSYYGLGSKLKHAAKRRAASGSSSSCRRMRAPLAAGSRMVPLRIACSGRSRLRVSRITLIHPDKKLIGNISWSARLLS